MADTDRVVYPDEVDDIKATAAAVNPENGDSNSVEETPAEVPEVKNRNMIVAPGNCPAGYQLDANGVCRQVFG